MASGPDSNARDFPMGFGAYDLLEELGRGGAGIVYRARQRSLGRVVALKVIASARFASTRDRDRFRSEAMIASRMDHPGIVPVYEVGEAEGRDFYTMAVVEGGSLDERLRAGPLEPLAAAKLLAELCEALHYAHGEGIVHRDLKPGNVLFDTAGSARIMDFGLAKDASAEHELTLSGEVVGTPSYMAPEQVTGTKAVGPAADVYALGCIFYACLTGKPPFRSATVVETFTQVVEAVPVPTRLANSAVPRDLDSICLKCLEKRPADRYASAQAVVDDLRAFFDNRPVCANDNRSNAFVRLLALETRHTDVLARWSSIGVVHSILVFALFAATGILFLLDRTSSAEHLTLWVPGGLLIATVPVFLRARKGSLTPVEVQLSHVWFVFALALAATGVCFLAAGSSFFDLVPIAFVEAALGIASMSIILRGSFWPLAVACGACALVSAFSPPWVMVPLGFLIAALHFTIAWRAGRHAPETPIAPQSSAQRADLEAVSGGHVQ